MLLEFIENIRSLIDFAVSVLALLALILFIGLMYKIYQFYVGAIAFFKFFIFYRSAVRELMIQFERFCRRYANIGDGEASPEDLEDGRGSEPMKINKKKPKGEKDWFGRIVLILDTLWEILACK